MMFGLGGAFLSFCVAFLLPETAGRHFAVIEEWAGAHATDPAGMALDYSRENGHER
jgi:hypothetical protein